MIKVNYFVFQIERKSVFISHVFMRDLGNKVAKHLFVATQI